MSDIYGIETTQLGHNRSDGDKFLSFSSRFDTLKIKQQGTGQLTDSSRVLTIAHNLGYKPVFMVHSQSDPVYQSEYGNYQDYFMVPIIGDVNRTVIAWADNTNLYIKASPKFGIRESYYYHSTNYDAGFTLGGTYVVGYGSGVGRTSGGTEVQGAIRFLGVNETSNITKAELGLKMAGSRNGDVYVKTRGIDEDNTNDLGSNPMSRPQTDAYVDNTCDNGITDTWGYEVTDIFKEISNRGGWSPGNAMGFHLLNRGNTNGHTIQTSLDYEATYLKVTKLISSTLANIKYTIYYNQINY